MHSVSSDDDAIKESQDIHKPPPTLDIKAILQSIKNAGKTTAFTQCNPQSINRFSETTCNYYAFDK